MGYQSKGFKRRRGGECSLQNRQGVLIWLDNKGHHTRIETRQQNIQVSQTGIDQQQGLHRHQTAPCAVGAGPKPLPVVAPKAKLPLVSEPLTFTVPRLIDPLLQLPSASNMS